MKIMVAVKRVVDHNIKVRIRADGSDVDITAAKMGVNPFDEHAIEAALRLKEQGVVTEILAVTLGAPDHQDVLRHALAMGVDRALLVESPALLQPLGVAKLLQAVVEQERPDLVILGKQAIDSDAGQVGQMLAALLSYGQATFISSLGIDGRDAMVTREVDGGSERLAISLPAVLTVDLRLNEPRFVKLPNLMMARKKPIETLRADDLGVDISPRLRQLRVAEPPVRKQGIRVGSVAELVEKLRVTEGIRI